MKTTININLAGRPFVIDDDAYDLLKNYLDTLQHAFNKTNGGSDIVDDIENRVSELLSELIAHGPHIVTIYDVDNVIQRIGKPEDIIDSERGENPDFTGDKDSSGRPTPPPFNGGERFNNCEAPQPQRKLYRDIDSNLLGGVCAGIAAYLKVDVVWIRLSFVALFLIGIFWVSNLAFFTFMAYVILWIVVPPAKSPLEKMRMRGEAPTIRNIGENVTSTFRGENCANGQTFDSSSSPSESFNQVLKTIIKIIAIFLIIILIPVAIGFSLGIIGCLVALLAFAIGGSSLAVTLFGTSLESVGNTEVLMGLMTAIGWLLTIGVPAILLLMYLLNNFKEIKFLNRTLNRWIFAIVWVIGIAGASVGTGYFITHGEEIVEDVSPKEEEKSDEKIVVENVLDSDTIISDSIEVKH